MPQVSYIIAAGFFRPFCKNILRLDGLYFDSDNTLGDSDKMNRPIFKAYRKADGIIFQSEFNRVQFIKFLGEPHCPNVIIPNGVPLEFSSEGEKVNYGFKKTLICSSKWRAHKRLDSIIKGFLEYGSPEVGLIIIGEGIEERVEHPNIKYLGRVPPEDLPKYMRGGDAFIHLSWIDNCPNTVVEALACGLPVLCTHNGGTKEIVGSNGIIIQCEEDYIFNKVKFYKPPECNKTKVANGIDQVLKWDKEMDVSYLTMDRVAHEYMAFHEYIK